MTEVHVRPGVAERLSLMIQLPTVSAELEQRGLGPWESFRDLLLREYPHLASTLELEQVGDLGLLFRWKGTGDGDPLVLMAHHDVVPAQEGHGWTHPPFDGVVQDGVVHGRGALDDKGPLVVIVEAVDNLAAAGFTPARDVYLSFGGDEETHGTAAQAVVARFRERGIVPWLVIDEGGAVVDAPLPFVRTTAAMVGLGEKGIIFVRLTTTSEGGHASAPPRSTATVRLARALTKLEPNPFPPRAPQSLVGMLRAFVPHASGPSRLLLRSLVAAPGLTARVFARMGGEAAAMVRTTVAATMLQAGTATNVLAPTAEAVLNLRLVTGATVEGTLERLRRAIGDDAVRVELLHGSAPSPESPADGPGFDAIRDAVAVAYPDAVTAPYLMMQASDARFVHQYAPRVYRFAPLRMTASQRAGIHGIDERVDVDSLERGEVFYRSLLEGLTT
jgi:carboxypeptidase PM20D1